MSMTLLDYAASSKDPLVPGIVNAMLDDVEDGGGGNILQILPIVNVDSLSVTFTKVNTEGSSSSVGWRPIGGTYPEGTMALYQESVNVGNIGGDIMTDEAFLIAKNYIEGADPRVVQAKYKAMLLNRKVNNACINGDKAVDPNAFNGMKKYLDTNQVYSVTSLPGGSGYTNGLAVWTSTSSALQKDYLTALDILLETVGGGKNTCLVMNRQCKRALKRACRDNSLFATTQDSYERNVDTYYGAPIINPGSKNAVETLTAAINDTNAVLPNNVTFGGASTACEILAFRKGEGDGVVLLQYRGITTRTVTNEMQQGPAMLTRVDWYPSLYVYKKSAVAKLAGVKAL